MKTFRSTLMFAALAVSASAFAAQPSTPDGAKAQYDAERARCMSGTTGQDQASCLRSAGAAYEESKQGRLRDPNTMYRDNALVRCRGLPAQDRNDCESRVAGEGTKSGSVKGGGDIKETVTTIPAPATKEH